MQDYNAYLPDPAQPVNPQAFLGGLPYNCPIQVQGVSASQNMQQLVPLVIGHAINAVQNNAGKNPIRGYYFNVISRNGWNNQELATLITGTCQLAELYIVMHRMPPEQAVLMAADKMSGWMTALLIQQNPQAFQNYLSPQVQQDTGIKLQEFAQASQEIQQMLGHQQSMQMQNGYQMAPGYNGVPNPGYPMNTGGYPPANMAGRGYPPAPTGGRGYPGPAGYGHNAPHPSQMGNRGQVGSMWTNPHNAGPPPMAAGANLGRGLKPRGASGPPQVEELTMSPDGTSEHVGWDHPTPPAGHRSMASGARHIPSHPLANQGHPQPTVAHGGPMPVGPESIFTNPSLVTNNQQQPTHVPCVEGEEWPKMSATPGRPYDSILLKDGSELRPACISGWTMTFREEMPYHVVYDPTVHMLFHLRTPDGTVRETIKEKTDAMGYLENELDPKLRALAIEQAQKSSPQVVGQNWDLASKLRPHPLQPVATDTVVAQPEAEEEAADGEEILPHVLPSVFQAHSLREAEVKLSVLSNTDASLKSSNGFLEFYYDEITPVEVENGNLLELMNELSQAVTFEEVHAKLAADRDKYPAAVFKTIDERLAVSISEAMDKNMSLTGWSITSFSDDYYDLLQALESKYSKSLVETLQEHAEEIINATLSVLTGGELLEYVTSLGGVAEETAPEKDGTRNVSANLLAFRSRTSITRVPWNRAALSMDIGNGGVIPKGIMGDLYKAVDSIFDRTLDMPVTFARRYIQTADKQLLEVRRGYLGVDSLLIFEVK